MFFFDRAASREKESTYRLKIVKECISAAATIATVAAGRSKSKHVVHQQLFYLVNQGDHPTSEVLKLGRHFIDCFFLRRFD